MDASKRTIDLGVEEISGMREECAGERAGVVDASREEPWSCSGLPRRGAWWCVLLRLAMGLGLAWPIFRRIRFSDLRLFLSHSNSKASLHPSGHRWNLFPFLKIFGTTAVHSQDRTVAELS